MSAAGYAVHTESAVALTAATARSILGVKAHANPGLQIKEFTFSFDGATGSATPALVELAYCTFATNSPGTQSTSCTVRQHYGRVLTAGFTAGHSWVAANEPTVITTGHAFYVPVFNGFLCKQFPLGQEPDTALAEGYVLRVTAPATVNARAAMVVERI